MNPRGSVILEGKAAEEFLKREREVKGYVLRGESGGKVSLVPQAQAMRRPMNGRIRWNAKHFKSIPVPEAARQQMLAGLPPERRREARERYHALVTQLIADAGRLKAQYGKVVYPKSITDEIKRLAWLEGDPTLPARIERGAAEAIEVYAGYLMRKAANQQNEKDRKRSTRDWHGHDNTTIQVGGLAANVRH